MNKPEALKALSEGHTIRHRYFSPDEWMKLEGRKYRFEDGVICEPSEFWAYREDQYWDEDWEIVT